MNFKSKTVMGENYEKAYLVRFRGHWVWRRRLSFLCPMEHRGERLEPKGLPPRSTKALIAPIIAILKADLRLSSDQAQHWAGLESALHDIVAKRAKSWAASRDLQTGRSINTPVVSDSWISREHPRRNIDNPTNGRAVAHAFARF
jgi:hypothetical protein